jgi:hypothetical protein
MTEPDRWISVLRAENSLMRFDNCLKLPQSLNKGSGEFVNVVFGEAQAIIRGDRVLYTPPTKRLSLL